jgi:hypothetical protein
MLCSRDLVTPCDIVTTPGSLAVLSMPYRNLQHTLHSEAYRNRLALGLRTLHLWFSALKPAPIVVGNSVQINDLLVRFVQDMFDCNQPIYIVVHAVLAFQKEFPRFGRRGALKRVWDSIASWKLEIRISLRTPMPPQVLSCLVLYAFVLGFVQETHKAHIWIPLGIVLWTGFDGMLRPGEFCALRVKDLLLPSNQLMSFCDSLVVLIKDPKNRKHFGRMQTTVVKDVALIAWLEWLVTDLPESARLIPMTTAKFRIHFHLMLKRLHLTSLKLTPASLRAGKATQLYLLGESIDRLKYAGRWKHLGTLEHYIQEASSMAVMSQLSALGAKALTSLLPFVNMLERPPSLPWSSYFSRHAQLRGIQNLSKRRHVTFS